LNYLQKVKTLKELYNKEYIKENFDTTLAYMKKNLPQNLWLNKEMAIIRFHIDLHFYSIKMLLSKIQQFSGYFEVLMNDNPNIMDWIKVRISKIIKENNVPQHVFKIAKKKKPKIAITQASQLTVPFIMSRANFVHKRRNASSITRRASLKIDNNSLIMDQQVSTIRRALYHYPGELDSNGKIVPGTDKWHHSNLNYQANAENFILLWLTSIGADTWYKKSERLDEYHYRLVTY